MLTGMQEQDAGRRTHAPFGPEIPSHSGREAGGRGFEGESDHRTTYALSDFQAFRRLL